MGKRAKLSLNLTSGESITYELNNISKVTIEDGEFYTYNDRGEGLVNIGIRRIQSATAELFSVDEDESKEDAILREMIDKSIKKVDEALDVIYYLRKDLVDIRSARQQKD